MAGAPWAAGFGIKGQNATNRGNDPDKAGLSCARSRPRPLCCGRTFLSAGLVDEARAEARRVLAAALPLLERGTPIVGLEPSCIYTFRDEYTALFPGDTLAAKLASAELVDEYLARGIRVDDTMNATWAQTIYDDLAPREAELKASGRWGDTVVPPPGADIQTKLLAVMGRVQ